MNRRQFLLGSGFAAAAFSEPALFAMTLPPVDSTASGSGDRRIGSADVEILSEHIAHLRRLDHRYGSGRVRQQVVQLLRREAEAVAYCRYSDKTGKALLRAVSQLAWLAGSMSADIGRHSLAQRYCIQALNLSISSGDRAYSANVLSHMSRMTVQIGQNADSEHDRVRLGRQAVALARAGANVAAGSASPGLTTLLHAVEARGHALAGDARSSRLAVAAAEQHYQNVTATSEPEWLSFYTEAELSADLGRCLRDSGEPVQGATLIHEALNKYEPWRMRSRSFAYSDLAVSCLAQQDAEGAAEAGANAIRHAEAVSSTRTGDRLRDLQRRIRGIHSGPRTLGELDSNISRYLRTEGRHLASAQ